jgi:hypothetical protein
MKKVYRIFGNKNDLKKNRKRNRKVLILSISLIFLNFIPQKIFAYADYDVNDSEFEYAINTYYKNQLKNDSRFFYAKYGNKEIQKAGFIEFNGDKVSIFYRGTNPYSLSNWQSDFDYTIVPSSNYLGIEGNVHKGFLEVFRSSWEGDDGIKARIEKYASSKKIKANQLNYTITGHSLGGALATILAAKLCTDKEFSVDYSSLHLATFGSPAVFDRMGAIDYEHLISPSRHRRYFTWLDPVPAVSRFYGAQHVGDPIILRAFYWYPHSAITYVDGLLRYLTLPR